MKNWLAIVRVFYLCGPGPMVSALEGGLRERGVFAFDIFKEMFAPPVPRITSLKDSYKVVFARSGVTVLWTPAAGTLLELGENTRSLWPVGAGPDSANAAL